jgi:hypothetical protein
VYFLAISIAHLLGVKVPGLFIYYDVPSYAYQDRIISFLSFGWAALFYVAAKDLRVTKIVLIASFVGLAGLANINYSTNFSEIVPDVSVTPFWGQTALLGLYIGWLTYLYRCSVQDLE